MNIKQICAVAVLSSMSWLTIGAQSLTPLQREVYCGQMLFRTPTTITVTLRNNGTETVTIKKVDTGCGCTTASYDRGSINPGQEAKVSLTFDGKQLGHFLRYVMITDSSSDTPTELTVSGEVVEKIANYDGNYPFKLGSLLTDVDNVEFDDIHKNYKAVRIINIMNPTGQNVVPTALRLPSYLSVRMQPEVLGPKQQGKMFITLNASELRDYGLTQTSIYLGKDPSDKVSPSKEITVAAILLPEAVAKNDVSRPYAPRLSMSSEQIDMTQIAKKSKVKDEIIISNTGKSALEISKLQLFTTGLEVKLDKSTLQPGEQTRLRVTGIAKILKKVKRHPRILMITNDPDKQKVVIYINK